MTPDHAKLLHDLNSALASLGFGFVMAIAAVLFLTWLGFGGFRSRWVLAFVLLFVAFFCVCMSAWAQDLRFSWHIDRDAIKVAAWTGAALAAAVLVGRIISIIVERAPPAALVACLSVPMGCGLVGVLSIWAAPKNLLLLVVIIGLVALVAIIAVLAWAIDREGQRNAQTRTRITHILHPDQDYPRQITIHGGEVNRQLPNHQKGVLRLPPARRSNG